MQKHQKALAGYIAAMLVFGTIGIFRRYISFSSGIIAMTRGIAGGLFLLLLTRASKKSPDSEGLKRNWKMLVLSGIAMGFNWILLFESYRYTTVAVATLCYYMQPVILILAAPIVLHDKLTAEKLAAVITAVVGMGMVTGVIGGTMPHGASLTGILLGLGAAALYAAVVLINMKITDVNSYDKTTAQLFIAGICMIPYLLLTNGFTGIEFDLRSCILLAIVSIVHTGLSYALYFHSMESLPSSTVALLGYVDPVTAVILSACLLKEPMTLIQAAGAVLIIGAAVFHELFQQKHSSAMQE